MRVDGVHQRLDGGFGFHGEHAFADQFERLRPDDVDAQNLAVIFVGDDFDEPVVVAQDARLAVGREREICRFSPCDPRRAPALRSSPTLPMPGSV